MVVGEVPYTFIKRGYFYFIRWIPADLRHHYQTHKISYSLKTKSPKVATKRSLIAADQLDAYWARLRNEAAQVPPQHLADNDPVKIIPSHAEENIEPKMSEAVAIYLRLKGNNRPKTFSNAANRACNYLYETCGDKHLGQYVKKDATTFRDDLFDRGMNGASVARVFGTVKTIFSFAANEAGLSLNNPFTNVYFDRKVGVSQRMPISEDDIRIIQDACKKKDDLLRWMVALVSDTGMRLAECAGILIDDLVVEGTDFPFVQIRPHPWRRLKTDSSERKVPLVGSSLWAAQRIINANDSGFAFPRYNQEDQTNSNSASAALNKWLKQVSSESNTMHAFRHSVRDRLCSVGAQSELADQIGGWSAAGNIGQSYGQGYSIEMMHEWMKKIVLD